jgi:hypothetical protein
MNVWFPKKLPSLVILRIIGGGEDDIAYWVRVSKNSGEGQEISTPSARTRTSTSVRRNQECLLTIQFFKLVHR